MVFQIFLFAVGILPLRGCRVEGRLVMSSPVRSSPTTFPVTGKSPEPLFLVFQIRLKRPIFSIFSASWSGILSLDYL